jgi:predicted acyl esterase
MNVLRAAVALVATAGIGLAGPVAAASPAGQASGDTSVTGVSIRMSDGTTLIGDVLYPADLVTGRRAKGSFPVLLSQNPYSCDTAASNLGFAEQGALGASYYVHHGYVYVSVCVRGTGRSGGDFDLFGPQQQRDGVELVDWAAHRLSGSNGRIGLIGCSYLGTNQLFTAAALPRNSAVKAMVPACTGGEIFREVGFSGGMPTQTTMNYFSSLGALMGPRAGAWGAQHVAIIRSGGTAAYETTYTDERTPANWARQIARADIPTLLWTGYHDMYALSAPELYTYLQNAHFHRPLYGELLPGQPTTPRYQVIVGPGGHGQGIDQSVVLNWFDTWIKGKHTGMDRTKTPMHLYELGTGKYIDSAAFPAVRSYTPYYLDDYGTLSASTPKTRSTLAIRYAPDASLSFTSKPFRQGARLAGPISASLVASASGTNLHLIATLYDVAPDGTTAKVTSGNLVASLRALDLRRSWFDRNGIDIRPYGDFTADHLLTPGKPYRLDFPMSERLAAIAPGHSLRLVLTTQTPASACGTLVGRDPCFPTAPQQATLPGTYQVSVGLSAINLPLAGLTPTRR